MARIPLAVRDFGAFDASFVPNRVDMVRLDPRFNLGDDIWNAVQDAFGARNPPSSFALQV